MAERHRTENRILIAFLGIGILGLIMMGIGLYLLPRSLSTEEVTVPGTRNDLKPQEERDALLRQKQQTSGGFVVLAFGIIFFVSMITVYGVSLLRMCLRDCCEPSVVSPVSYDSPVYGRDLEQGEAFAATPLEDSRGVEEMPSALQEEVAERPRSASAPPAISLLRTMVPALKEEHATPTTHLPEGAQLFHLSIQSEHGTHPILSTDSSPRETTMP